MSALITQLKTAFCQSALISPPLSYITALPPREKNVFLAVGRTTKTPPPPSPLAHGVPYLWYFCVADSAASSSRPLLPLYPSLVLRGSFPVGLGPEPVLVALGLVLVTRQAFKPPVVLGSPLPMSCHVGSFCVTSCHVAPFHEEYVYVSQHTCTDNTHDR